jgi:tetratricopeptide (TPR) repeat protein
MDDEKSTENVSTSSPSEDVHHKQRIVQNYRLIWIDGSIDLLDEDYQNMVAQLRDVVNDVQIFTQSDECIHFLNTINVEKVFVITTGYLGQHLVPDIHDLPQLDAIYIFCGNKSRHEQWTKQWIKIKGIHTDIKPLCQALKQAAKQCNEDSIAMSFARVSEETSSENLNQLEPSFMYTQIFKEILFEMEHDEKSIKDLATYCRKLYNDNKGELAVINEFEHSYQLKSPIWWYTRECFTYQMLNRALRTLEGDTIINMGFFVRDLHKQIEEVHQKQVGSYHGKCFVVYRGQGLLEADFEKLVKSQGGLISFNNFLSTSTQEEVSLGFAKSALAKTNMVGILFKMTIDPSVSSAPFASIRELSYFQTEEEILFSMHTIFRIGEINKIDNNKPLYQVDLRFTADDDKQLRILTERIRQEVASATGWRRLGRLLTQLDQFDKAEELYNVLLEQTSDESEKGLYYNQLGYIKDGQGDYEKAIEYYENALQMWANTLPSNHPYFATCFNNMGLVYKNMEQYSEALQFLEGSLKMSQKVLPPNDPDLAISHNNIGEVYRNMGEYSKALSFYQTALEIWQQTLPPNHPNLAISYTNIGLAYDNMNEYSKALSFYEKALEIKQKVLPSNHPDLAISYNNIAGVYGYMGEYSKALSFYEKALEIKQKSLSPNHPSVATSYGNIAGVYDNMGEYSKALSYLERALDINQRSLPPNHPSIGIIQEAIEYVKNKM